MDKITNKEEITDIAELMDEDAVKLMNEIKAMRNHIFNFLDRTILVDKLKDLIETSDVLDFSSDLSRKFIDYKRPIFNIKVDTEKAKTKYPGKLDTAEREAKYYSDIIHSEIIKKFNTFITKALLNDENEEVLNFLKGKSIFIDNKYDNKDIYDISLNLVSTFGMRLNKQDNSIIALEFMI